MYSDEDISRRILGPSFTLGCLAAVIGGVHVAREHNQRLCSLHLVYGLLVDGNEDAMALAILLLNGCNIFKLKRAVLAGIDGLEGPFLDDVHSCSISQEIEGVLLYASDLRQRSSRYQDINSAHLLAALCQLEFRSGAFLSENTPLQELERGLKKLFENQDRRRDLEP